MQRQWRTIEWAEEAGQIQKSVGPFLDKRLMEERVSMYRRQFPSSHDKPTRAQSIRGRFAQGKLYLPRNKDWAHRLVSQMMEFPVGRHDDAVDVLSLFGRILDDSRRPRVAQTPEKQKWPQDLTIAELIKRQGARMRAALVDR